MAMHPPPFQQQMSNCWDQYHRWYSRQVCILIAIVIDVVLLCCMRDLKQGCKTGSSEGDDGQESSPRQQLAKLAEWADQHTVCSFALYDDCGALRIGRAGVEIWEKEEDNGVSL